MRVLVCGGRDYGGREAVFSELDRLLAEHGHPKDLRERRLRVIVDSAVWMHKYSYCKWEIIRRINRRAGKELVSDLFFLLADDADEE